MRARATVLGLGLVSAGCGAPPAPSLTDGAPTDGVPTASRATYVTHEDTRIIVGTDEDHVIVTQPLVEVIPPTDGDPAVLNLDFDSIGSMGIEGGVLFAGVYALDGTLVADQIVDLDGDTLEIPGADFTVRFYYRSCDGNCGLLDPAQELCTVEHAFDAGDDYDVSVDGSNAGEPRCRVVEIRED